MISANDTDLVSESLSGNRDAFGQIVSRYQSLICSLAYSAVGNLGQSEDLAQETFITAWKHLGKLRERDKLRAWLCGIARNRVNNFLRREGRKPLRKAEPLEEISETHSPEPLPDDYAISKEEAEILWRSLERIPEIYREPLILFYREHQSIETVAANLDLTEDAVKQRLSRGRKLLQEQVLAFVEGALARTNPGQAFTLNVLAALSSVTTSAKVATLGAAVKGGAGAKAAGVMGWFGAIFTPLLVIFGNYKSYRMSMDEAQTDIERHHIKKFFRNSLLATLAISAVAAVPVLVWAFQTHQNAATVGGFLFSQIIVIYFLTVCAFVFASLPQRRQYLAKILAEKHAGHFPPVAYEFRSRASLFGWPLVHVRIGDRFDVMRGPVKAWIAIGSSHSVGLIFASGGIAIAPISFGGIAVGGLSFSAIGIGIISFSAISLGVWAFGALAFGWQICCGCGIAWNAAMGDVVAAHQFAAGEVAHAAQANTEIATQFFQQSPFFNIAQTIGRHSILLMLIWVVPMMLQSRLIARARRQREQPDL